jgi:presenilin-like A22 family membrane protease
LVVFGFHILLIGFLMKLHQKIPQILWYITLLAGVSYVVVSALKLVSPDAQLVDTLVMVLALPMTIGELGLAVWLLIKGGKEAKVEAHN